MKNSTIEVAERTSCKTADLGQLNMLVGTITDGKCNVLLCSPGLPMVIQEMREGDTILYNTPEEVGLEVRLESIRDRRLGFAVTRVPQRV